MTPPLIRLTDVSAGYGGRSVLNHCSLEVHEREMLVLRGRNGGGKTTLLKVLAGLLAPMQGEVWRREGLTVGYLPQYRTIDREFPPHGLRHRALGTPMHAEMVATLQ